MVEPAIPHGILISTVMKQANRGQMLLSEMANPVVDMKLTTWKIPVMNESPPVKPADDIFSDNATRREAIRMVST